MKTIFRKELADYFTSWRVFILFLLVYGISASGLFAAWEGIREAVSQGMSSSVGGEEFIFLKLFTTAGKTLPLSLASFLSLFIPIIGIALGFDAINREYSTGTMSRILSQPLYRDSVINGKFLAGIVTLSIMMLATVLIVSGVGLAMIGVPPTAEEIIRLFLYLFVVIIFGSFWMGLAILFSVITRRVATSLLSSIAVWLFFAFFIGLIASAVAPLNVETDAEIVRNFGIQQMILRVSPNFLFGQINAVLLEPVAVGTLGLVTMSQISRLIPNPLSLGQSLLLVWPHLTTLVSLTILCFAASFVVFMRQEIRST